jgi:2-polyprenyl-3-methyl-5-hydroxy-6-metoxy-1,4-benzoquinol methylase
MRGEPSGKELNLSEGTARGPGTDTTGDAPPRCNLCGGPASALLAGEPSVVRCSSCGLVSLGEFPSKAEQQARYQESYYDPEKGERFLGLFERALRLFKKLRVRAILRRMPGPGSLLDVGCGRGDLLELFQERGWRAVGTQVSQTAAKAARALRGVEVIVGELPQLSLPEKSFHAVTFFHVLEHLDKPSDYLRKAHELLAPGGLLVVEVPNWESPGFRLLGRRGFCFDHPNHLVFFTPASLRRLLAECGFEVEAESQFSLEYSPYTTLQNLLNALPGEPNRLYRALALSADARRLRKSPWTWLHALLAAVLAVPAFLISLASPAFTAGNTLRLYCRKQEESRSASVESARAEESSDPPA